MTAEIDNAEFDAVFRMLVSEREDHRTKLDVAKLAILRKCAALMVSDDPKDAKTLVELMALAPPVVRRVVVEPTLEELCAPDHEPDLSALDDADLYEAERLSALLHSRACPIPDARRTVALELVRTLNGPSYHGGVDDLDGMEPGTRRDLVQAVRLQVEELLRPLHPREVFQMEDLRGEVRDLKDEIERLSATCTWRGPQRLASSSR
jgi:hypothetical protein